MSRRAFSQSEQRLRASTSRNYNMPPSAAKKSIGMKAKNTTTSSISSLLEFLESTSYNEALSMRALHSPSAKVVFSIFEHTMRLSYPSFVLPTGKGETEECFLGILRSFGYRNAISKSMLSTPGAYHAWPHLLIALEWLRNELAEAEVILESDEMFVSDLDKAESEVPVAKTGMDMILACKDDVLRGLDPSEDVIEQFRTKVYATFGVSQEQIEAMERELEQLQNEPTAESLDARQKELQVAIRETENSITMATDEYEHVSAKLSGTEVAAKHAAGTLEELIKERNSLMADICQLESTVASQQVKYGSLVQAHQMQTQRYQQRLKVEHDLSEENQNKSLELGRLDGIIPQALDKYNKLVMSLRKNPSCPDLPFRHYVANFDPIKEIPVLCADLKNARKQLETLEATLRQEEVELSSDLADSKNDLQRKIQATEALKKRLSETQSMTANMEEEHAKGVVESAKWLSETDLAISEMSLNNETREAKIKSLMEEYQRYQDGYKYYLNLNIKTREMKENVIKQTKDFLECFKLTYEAKVRDKASRQRAYTEFRQEMLEKYAALDRRSAELLTQATTIKTAADSLCLNL